MQVGSFTAAGAVNNTSSPAANAVNLLVETVVLNYMALHGEEGNFPTLFPSQGLGSSTLRDSLTIMAPIVNGTVSNPV
jgi:hypothetical protein